jgi:predicted O-methyltransferase YrrM
MDIATAARGRVSSGERTLTLEKADVLSGLARDKPLFHYAYDDGLRRGDLLERQDGDCSYSVTPEVLRWIADRLTGDMVTIETGAGYTSVLFAALAEHHYCCTFSHLEVDKVREYLRRIGVPGHKLTLVLGSTDKTLPALELENRVDFAYIDGCHGYPFPALDWHYIDRYLKIGGLIGMDNVELRPVREHCEFLQENGTYRLVGEVFEGYFVRFYEKLADQEREWEYQAYSRAKKDPCDWRLPTRIRRKASKLIKPYLY